MITQISRTFSALVCALVITGPSMAGLTLEAPGTSISLPEDICSKRKDLVKNALDLTHKYGDLRYRFGSANPRSGGLDCSGASQYLLRQIQLQPPRTSSAQFDWIRRNGSLTQVPQNARTLEHAAYAELKPGDLVFWSGTYRPNDGRANGITHVAVYLGQQHDGRHVIAGATSSRSRNPSGFTIQDLRPNNGGPRIVGYGPPPGFDQEN